ncbi:AAA family ATPase [Alkalicoccobacillus plakortidis]|uniref:Nuclease SbcCD subunit C n=1 Tax=Alkalicoccobacillus plakortidis TaxID=444060 RepID=A0ABT0XI74_9BACI|nr:AAA family ATPase [Alkalicoccobacillus plakortidis]MCM2675602.1 hypothetical protein [Alkalicoccobacillus plakortidis]
MNKQMKLVSLTLTNFKGVKSFSLKADGQDTKAYGDNATGKTTVFDAFLWILFGKDSQNRTDFQIKTVTQDGKEVHGLSHEVEAVFLVDDTKLSLKKVYAEKWTKKRGAAHKEFTGHTTDYFIDEVPSKKKEYELKVSSIVDEDVFKLLTSPAYFNDHLKWQKRREILLEVSGDVSDEEVIASNKDLATLPQFLNNRSIEDHRKVIASKRSEINKELDKIPVRIDEVKRALPDVSGLNEADIKVDIASTKSKIEDKEAEISRIKNGTEVSVKEKEIREIEMQLMDLKNDHQQKNFAKVNEKRSEYYKAEESLDEAKRLLKQKQTEYDSEKSKIDRLNESIKELREEWSHVNSKTFDFTGDTDCPSCGQVLPLDKLQSAKEKAQANFNRHKSDRLEAINVEGKEKAAQVEQIKEKQNGYESYLATLTNEIDQKKEAVQALDKEIQDLKAGTSSLEDDPAYKDKLKESQVIKESIENLRSSTKESLEKAKHEIAKLRYKLSEVLEADLSKFNTVNQSKERIDQLLDQEKKLAGEYEKLEHELYLTEEFIRSKVELLEEKINSKFEFARFKLFDQQINDGLRETCETLFKGVPYSGGLNNAARINVGLDIINTLSKHYGLSAPIFVDNAEAVTKLIDVDSQVISLVVSEGDKELRVVS